MADRPVLSRRWLLFFGLISVGMAAKIAIFEVADDSGGIDAVLRFVVWIVLAALWLTAGHRAPHPYRDGSTPDPSIPVSRLPRWRRPPDPLPFGAWIVIPVILVWGSIFALGILAVFSSLAGPWPVVGGVTALLGLYHWRKRRPRRRRRTAALPIGALILVPVLVCVAVLVAVIVSAVAG